MKYNNNIRQARKNSTFLSTGWLFADLLLALSVIFLISGSKATNNTPFTAIPTFTKTPVNIFGPFLQNETPTPTNIFFTPTPTIEISNESQIGLDQTPVIIVIHVNPENFLKGYSGAVDGFRASLKKSLSDYSSERAGLVITLGFHTNIGSGMQLARSGNSELRNLYPNVFRNSVMKPFWFSVDEINTSGTIKFEIYFFTNTNP